MNRISVLGSLLAALLLSGAVAAPANHGVPNLASREFGWQQNVEDWEPPPPGKQRACAVKGTSVAWPLNSSSFVFCI